MITERETVRAPRDTATTFTPYNFQYRRNMRNDFIRFIIFQALAQGYRFDKLALYHFVNCYFETEDIPERLTLNGFMTMLYRNCEGIWAIDVIDGEEVVSKSKDWHYLEMPERQEERSGKLVSIILDRLVIEKRIMRNHGSGYFFKTDRL